MLISEIKDKALRKLAELRRDNSSFPHSDELCLGFAWDATPERVDFWKSVNNGLILTNKNKDE